MEINLFSVIYITTCLEALGNLRLQSARSCTEYNIRPTAEDMMKQVGKKKWGADVAQKWVSVLQLEICMRYLVW